MRSLLQEVQSALTASATPDTLAPTVAHVRSVTLISTKKDLDLRLAPTVWQTQSLVLAVP
jgi:hypothetical protein